MHLGKKTTPDNLSELCKMTSTTVPAVIKYLTALTPCQRSHPVVRSTHSSLLWLEQLEQMQDLTYSGRQTFQKELELPFKPLGLGKGTSLRTWLSLPEKVYQTLLLSKNHTLVTNIPLMHEEEDPFTDFLK